MNDVVLSVRQIRKRFGALQVLDDVSLDVSRGEAVCVLGPSGSGKSTLLRCINHLERPDEGQVFLAGKPIGRAAGGRVVMSDRELSGMRTRIGMVFQHFALWPHMTVLRNLTEAPVHVQGRNREEAVAEAQTLLKRVGLQDKRDAYPASLSGGQKQRVGIARALMMKPEVVLFDEPTSALDPELVGEVLAVIRDLARDGLTMVIVTHEMGFAREVGSRIVFMDQGRIVETAEPAKFFADPATPRARQFIDRYARDIAR